MEWIFLCYTLVILISSIHIRTGLTFVCRLGIGLNSNIQNAYVCDGKRDCIDGSDEEVQACLDYGRRPSSCHCKDVKDCAFQDIGFCIECQENYYGLNCELYSEKTCNCMSSFECRFNATCICKDDSWQGIRCEDQVEMKIQIPDIFVSQIPIDIPGIFVSKTPQEIPEIKSHKSLGAGEIVAITIGAVMSIVVTVCCKIMFKKRRMRASNNQISRIQQREIRQVHILVIGCRNEEENRASDASYTNMAYPAGHEDFSRSPSFEPPPSYEVSQENFSYPVIHSNEFNVTDRMSGADHRSGHTTPYINCEPPSYESLGR